MVGPRFFDGIIGDTGKFEMHHMRLMLGFKVLVLCYSGYDEFCSQGDAVQEVLFLATVQVIVRDTMFPNSHREKPRVCRKDWH